MPRLAGKVAVVTGATGVLCSVLAESLLNEGAKVALVVRNEERAKALQKKLAGKGLKETLSLIADVLDKASLEAARERILAEWGRIDVLVNGAGGNDPKGTCPAEQFAEGTKLEDSFFGLDPAGFETVNKLNFLGSVLPAQVFCRAMLKGGGSVINISSVAAFQPLTKVGAYAAAKASIENFTRWLAVHLAPARVRINAIAPGFFLTEQNRFLLLEKDGKTLTPRGNKILAKTPMHRFGDPKDLCGALTYLACDESAFVTGIVLPVDGGFLAYSGV